MADVTTDNELERPESTATAQTAEDLADTPPPPDPQSLRIIELLFFAYRDFTADADEILAQLGFGRAHHRAMHFICRHPGIRVADLLEILKITKQSLARVLKDLRDRGFIAQVRGKTDRRQRLLYPRPDGKALIVRLAGRQSERINAALDAAGVDSPDTLAAFLFAMIRAQEREDIAALIATGDGLDANGEIDE
jgi:DNA-binding MarR family transcriptional regulator